MNVTVEIKKISFILIFNMVFLLNLNASPPIDIPGGIVVHLDCSDAELTASLATSDRVLVHGLSSNRNYVDEARSKIAKKRNLWTSFG